MGKTRESRQPPATTLRNASPSAAAEERSTLDQPPTGTAIPPLSLAEVLARLQELMSAEKNIPLAEDLIWGARAIAREIYGKSDDQHQKKVYHLYQTSRTPIVKIGATYVVRRSRLRVWIIEMEQRGLSGKRGIPPILSPDKDPPPTSRRPAAPTSGNKTPPAGDQERPHE